MDRMRSSSGYSWKPWLVYNGLPPRAVHVGHEKDGSPIYVGRTKYNDGAVVVKIVPSREFASFCNERREKMIESLDVLVGDGFEWVRSGGGHIPDGAIVCGQSSKNRPVFIGRANHKHSLIPGQIEVFDGNLIIPFEGDVVTYQYYDVLINRSEIGNGHHVNSEIKKGDEINNDPVSERSEYEDEDVCCAYFDFDRRPTVSRSNEKLCWKAAINSEAPPAGAVVAGHDSDGSTIYVGRVMYEGNQLPAKVIPQKHLCHTQFNGEEIEMISYEALCYGNVAWVRFRGTIPHNALVCGQTAKSENVYIGRGDYLCSLTPGRVFASEKVLYLPHSWNEHRITNFEILIDEDAVDNPEEQVQESAVEPKWIHTKREQPAPEGSLKAGRDSDGADIYLGRVQHDGNRYVGKVIPSKQICSTTYDGKVIQKFSYEALCASNVSWVSFSETIPENSVECGKTRDGEPVYIGRGEFKSELIPGSVLAQDKKLRIAYQEEEVLCDKFEILVFDSV